MAEQYERPRVSPEMVGQTSPDPNETARKDQAGRGLPGYAATATGTFIVVALLFLIFLIVIGVILLGQ